MEKFYFKSNNLTLKDNHAPIDLILNLKNETKSGIGEIIVENGDGDMITVQARLISEESDLLKVMHILRPRSQIGRRISWKRRYLRKNHQ